MPIDSQTNRPPRRNKWIFISIILILMISASLVLLWFWIPSLAAKKINAEAERRALRISYSKISYSFSELSLSDLVIQPRSNEHIVVKAKSASIKLYRFQPNFISIKDADIFLEGTVHEVRNVFEQVRNAEERIPSKEHIPIEITAGKFHWNRLVGNDSQLSFNQVSVRQDPQNNEMSLSLKNGTFDIGAYQFKPLSMTLESKSADFLHAFVGFNSEKNGQAMLTYEHANQAETIEIILKDFALQMLHPPTSIDASKSTLTGKISYIRNKTESSQAKVTLESLTLNNVSLGPVSVSPTLTANISWTAQSKGKELGVMHADSTSQLLIGNSKYILHAQGDVMTGPEGMGPYRAKLDWSLDPIACSDLAQKLTSGIIRNAVQGTVSGHGQVNVNAADFWHANITRSFEIGCQFSLGGLLKDLPL